MAKILVKGELFEEVSPTTLYEAEFESILLQYRAHIYPDHYLVPFKTLVSSEQEKRIPDLALIEKNYRSWWVIEVELGHHSFESHVLPQVETLSHAYYGYEVAEYLADQCSSLHLERLYDLMKGMQARVIVAVNMPRPNWVEPLRRYDAIVSTFQIFRSRKNQHIVLMNGEQPHPNLKAITKCRLHSFMKTYLVLDSPGGLGVANGETVSITYAGAVTEWRRTDIRNAVWLAFQGKHIPIESNTDYVILQDDDGGLTLRKPGNY